MGFPLSTCSVPPKNPPVSSFQVPSQGGGTYTLVNVEDVPGVGPFTVIVFVECVIPVVDIVETYFETLFPCLTNTLLSKSLESKRVRVGGVAASHRVVDTVR